MKLVNCSRLLFRIGKYQKKAKFRLHKRYYLQVWTYGEKTWMWTRIHRWNVTEWI